MDWKRKLTSRKLWLAVSGFVGMLLVAFGVSRETATQVTAIIMAGASVVAYILAEGFVDAQSAGAWENEAGDGKQGEEEADWAE